MNPAAMNPDLMRHLIEEDKAKQPVVWDMGQRSSDRDGLPTPGPNDEYIYEYKYMADGNKFRVKLNNPDYVRPEPAKPVVTEEGAVTIGAESFSFAEAKLPPLDERIAMALNCYEGITDDRLIAVTDDPTFKVAGIWTPDNTQKTQSTGVVIMCGPEASAKFPKLRPGCRIVWNFTAGTSLPFFSNCEAKVLRWTQVEVILKDDSAMKYFEEGQ